MKQTQHAAALPVQIGIMTRRRALQAMALGSAALAFPASDGDSPPEWRERILAFLETLRRADHGYAWPGQDRSHLTPSFFAVGAHHLLNVLPPRQQELAQFIRDNHPSRLKKLEQEHRVFEYQQIQALLWLGESAEEFRETVKKWTAPPGYLKQYQRNGYPVFRSALAAIACRGLLKAPVSDLSPEFSEYLAARERSNGSFNNTPASDGGDGHILNTWWALEAYQAWQREPLHAERLPDWIRQCQLPSGGFTYAPNPAFGGVDDVAYTWAALRLLSHLKVFPIRREECERCLLSLWNEDGGFGDRPGWSSNPMATYYALDSLRLLGTSNRSPQVEPVKRARPQPLPSDLQVYSIQLEAHGKGSPTEAVDLARALRIHLWGAKGASPAWMKKARQIAESQQAPVQFFVSDEDYGTWVDVPGLGAYSHTSDVIAPAGVDYGPSLARAGVVTWPVFRQQRLEPLLRAQGRLIWQFGENEELVRIFLDDSLERGGYAAISTYHFGNPDFTNTEPFLHRYRGRIPFVALQDAHGPEPWWFADMTAGFRTLFLAREPSWDAWLEALTQNWVAAVRRDSLTGGAIWFQAGSEEVLAYVKARENEWRWWDNPAISRPMVSIVAVRPEDEFETGRPEKGIVVRVRCAWENTTQGLPKKPLAELLELIVDGERVEPRLTAPKQRNSPNFLDHYHFVHLDPLRSGTHQAVARVRELASGRIHERSIRFISA